MVKYIINGLTKWQVRGNYFYFGKSKILDLIEKSHHISMAMVLVVLSLFPPFGLAGGPLR